MTKTTTTNTTPSIFKATTPVTATTDQKSVPTLSVATMQTKTVKDLHNYLDDYFTDNVLARYSMTRPSARAKKAELITFITDLYNNIRNVHSAVAPVAASAKPAPKKPVPKTTKPATPAEPVETATRTSRKEREFATKFPDFIERQVDEEMVKYSKCDDMYTTLDSIRKASEDGYTLLFACFWSPRLLKQFNYKEQFDVDECPKAFPDNLDVAELLLTCDTMPKLFALSLETEAMYAFREEDLEQVDGIRVANGLEFEIYQHKDAE